MNYLENVNIELFAKIMSFTNIKDSYNLLFVNKNISNIISKEIHKYKILFYLNNDYTKFYEMLNMYNYSQEEKIMDKIIIRSFMRIPNIDMSLVCAMYDLRFIFELMFMGFGRNKEIIKNICSPHFYIHFYHKLNSIISSDRKETINRIEKSHYLFSLKQNPTFTTLIKQREDFKWESLKI